MFGFHYRIEIYTPAHKRQFGYYSLPILVDEALVGRIDLKNDRQRGVLRVQSAHAEPVLTDATPARLAHELHAMARWLGLAGVTVEDKGTLSPALRAAAAVS